MKNRTIHFIAVLSALLLASAAGACSDGQETAPAAPAVSMPEEGALAPVAVTCDDILTGTYAHTFRLTLDTPASNYLMGDIRVDESLVEAYNAEHGTAYEVLPSNIYKLAGGRDLIIPVGETESNEIRIEFPGTLFGLKKDVKYLLPVVFDFDETIADKFGVKNPVHYLAVDVDRELIYTPGLLLSGSNAMRTTLNLPDNEVVTLENNTHTFEMRIFPYTWNNGTTYIGTWRGKDTGNNNENFSGCEIRVGNANGAANIGNRQCDLTLTNQGKIISTGQWHTLTITCDGEKTGQNTEIAYRYYLDGELVSEAKPTKRFGPTSSQRFQVGYTFTGFQFGNGNSYIFNGLVGEIRMWKNVLTQDEIRANLQTVANPSKELMHAYWKIDEGQGSVLKDYSGNGRDLTFSGSDIVWSAEMER